MPVVASEEIPSPFGAATTAAPAAARARPSRPHAARPATPPPAPAPVNTRPRPAAPAAAARSGTAQPIQRVRRSVGRPRSFSLARLLRTATAYAGIAIIGTIATAVGVAPVCAPRVHRVAAGETVTAIARDEGISVPILLEAQSGSDIRRRPSLIRTGQLIRLPGSTDLLAHWDSWPAPIVATWHAVRFELSRMLSKNGGSCLAGLLK